MMKLLKELIALAAILGSLSQAFAFDESKGFKGRVRSVDLTWKSMILEARIEGYGESVLVAVTPVHLVDEDGGAVRISNLQRGTEVFVSHVGPFRETLPMIPLGNSSRVTVLRPKIEGRISRIENRADAGQTWLHVGEAAESRIVRTTPQTQMPWRELKVGDEIVVRYDGTVLESMPPQITAQTIRLMDPLPRPGFRGKVLEAHVFRGKLSIIVESDLPDHGTSMVSVDAEKLVDARDRDLSPSSVTVGSQVFVENTGGFLPGYPLRLPFPTKVIVTAGKL